ncbi:unnamed protein product [Spodoptera exigua]|nr:unnamed protein product [Spodoptera exigua]
MDDGRWTMDDGRWTMDDGRWTMDDGRWTMDDGRWAMDDGQWTLGDERWTMDDGPASVAAAAGGARAAFLQRDKLYKQRLKQLGKVQAGLVVRGHHLAAQALTAVAHCHHCGLLIAGIAPQAYVCSDCQLRVHRACARQVDEACCLDHQPPDHHNNRISRFMERIHANNQPNNLDTNDKKSRKTSATTHFLNMERSVRKAEDDLPWDQTLTPIIGPSVRRVAFRARLKEPFDHHKRGPKGLMFSRGRGVSAMRYRDLGTEQEKEQGGF